MPNFALFSSGSFPSIVDWRALTSVWQLKLPQPHIAASNLGHHPRHPLFVG